MDSQPPAARPRGTESAPTPARGRFAPSTTGPAHVGTLLAALLCWLDARAVGGQILLRLEDLDPARCRPGFAVALQDALAWLGLDFDAVEVQSAAHARHAAALDRLGAAGRLYACHCSRRTLQAAGRPAPDGGFAYTNTCRANALPGVTWRASPWPVRARLDAGIVTPASSPELAQDPARAMGDPVVRRRDGGVAYQLAVVVDDAAWGVTRVVRGRDIAASTATQVALQRLLGLPEPAYRHHLLALEARGDKLSKAHGAVGAEVLRQLVTASEWVGFLASCAGLRPDASPLRARDLVADFAWHRVANSDVVVHLEGGKPHKIRLQ